MVNEAFFKQAVVIAAAFVQNGDVRCGNSLREDSTAMLMTGDLITSAYRTIERAHREIDEANKDRDV